jgi:hypothetical protein
MSAQPIDLLRSVTKLGQDLRRMLCQVGRRIMLYPPRSPQNCLRRNTA